MNTPKRFPGVVCWDDRSREKVMDTMALNVGPAVFSATHYPCLLLKSGAVEGSLLRITEEEYLADFLNPELPHVLDVAAGDSGTGKSHFIRWVYNAILRLPETERARYRVQLVPRDAASLAGVLFALFEGLTGADVDRLRDKIEQAAVKLTEQGTVERLLNEYSLVLRPGNVEGLQFVAPSGYDPEFFTEITAKLPDLLHDPAVRKRLASGGDSLVARQALYLSSPRGDRQAIKNIAARLHWTDTDLSFTVPQAKSVVGSANEIAMQLATDDACRKIAAEILNQAFPEVSKSLLNLSRGDLGRALKEVRRSLLKQNQELVLLIEDMSVTQTIDQDLLEALIVRTREGDGEEICKLRALVGLTNEDYTGLRSNIRGRLRQTLHFTVAFSGEDGGADDRIGRTDFLDFASRYLNAARHALDELDSWFGNSQGDSELGSYCYKSGCPNQEQCHRVFGEVNGRGLYPFTSESLIRLYGQVQSQDDDRQHQIFNPRVLVGQVLSTVLKMAAAAIPNNAFPAPQIAHTFRLRNTKATLADQLNQKLPGRPDLAARLLTAVQIYSPNAAEGTLQSEIPEVFGLPGDKLTPQIQKKEPWKAVETLKPPQEEKSKADGETSQVGPSIDEFDAWASGGELQETPLNDWRGLLFEAIFGRIDWDQPGFASVVNRFQRRYITFEGQATSPVAGGRVVLQIPRSVESAIALKGLKTGFEDGEEKEGLRQLELAGSLIDKLARDVQRQIAALLVVENEPTPEIVAAQHLALGALLRGRLLASHDDATSLSAALELWPDQDAKGSIDWEQIAEAYRRHGRDVREWLVARLACSKGGETGNFVDPSRVLEALRRVRSTGALDPLPASAMAWHEFDKVLPLVEKVGKYLEQVVTKIGAAAIAWRQVVEPVVGNDDWTVLCAKAKELAPQAAGQQLLEQPLTAQFEETCRHMSTKAEVMRRCLSAARAIEAKALGERVRAAAQLDPAFLSESLQFLQQASNWFTGALSKAQKTLEAVPSLSAIKQELSERVESIERHIVELSR